MEHESLTEAELAGLKKANDSESARRQQEISDLQTKIPVLQEQFDDVAREEARIIEGKNSGLTLRELMQQREQTYSKLNEARLRLARLIEGDI